MSRRKMERVVKVVNRISEMKSCDFEDFDALMDRFVREGLTRQQALHEIHKLKFPRKRKKR